MTIPYVAGEVLLASELNKGYWQTKAVTTAGTATTLQVNDCFLSDFRHYRIYISGSSATAGNLTLQLTSSGTAATTTYYWNQVLRDYGATPSNTVTSSGGSTSSFRLGLLNTGTLLATSSIVCDVLDPRVLYPTQFASMNSYNASVGYSIMGTHYSGATYDGFKLTGAGNLSINVVVYGLAGA